MIELGGKKYTICLTIKGEEGVVIRKAETGELLQYVSTRGKQGENLEAIQKLTMNYGIAGEEIMLSLFYCIDSWLNSGCLWCLGSSSVVKYMERGEAKDKDWVVRKRFCRTGCRNSYTLDLYEAFSAGTWNFSLSVI